jgi:hypothetical protein
MWETFVKDHGVQPFVHTQYRVDRRIRWVDESGNLKCPLAEASVSIQTGKGEEELVSSVRCSFRVKPCNVSGQFSLFQRAANWNI